MNQVDSNEIFQTDNRTECYHGTTIFDTDMIDNESTVAGSPDPELIARQDDPDFALALHLVREEEVEICRREEKLTISLPSICPKRSM
eukprot:1879868-Rhodomonas_salina.2